MVLCRTKVNVFDLGSFLIKPVQRILKYPLFLDELLKVTDLPGPSDDKTCYRDLMIAVKMIQNVASLINDEIRRKHLGTFQSFYSVGCIGYV